MIALAKLVGVLITVMGLLLFAFPPFTQKVFDFFMKGKNIYIAGVIRIAAGVVLLGAASHSLVPMAAIALGFMFFVSGLVIFTTNPEKMKEFLKSYREMPGIVIRLLGLVAASFGVLIFSIF